MTEQEKQIEAVANDLCEIDKKFEAYCHKMMCVNCSLYYGKIDCQNYYIATELYNAGYRKEGDVVPRSEVERLSNELLDKDIEVENEVHRLNAYIEALEYELEKAKQKVAREIFGKIHKEIELALASNYKAKQERIDKHYNGMSGVIDDFISLVDGKIQALRGIDDFIEELEKKYIGE